MSSFHVYVTHDFVRKPPNSNTIVFNGDDHRDTLLGNDSSVIISWYVDKIDSRILFHLS